MQRAIGPVLGLLVQAALFAVRLQRDEDRLRCTPLVLVEGVTEHALHRAPVAVDECVGLDAGVGVHCATPVRAGRRVSLEQAPVGGGLCVRVGLGFFCLPLGGEIRGQRGMNPVAAVRVLGQQTDAGSLVEHRIPVARADVAEALRSVFLC
jgi:hypothetical protein